MKKEECYDEISKLSDKLQSRILSYLSDFDIARSIRIMNSNFSRNTFSKIQTIDISDLNSANAIMTLKILVNDANIASSVEVILGVNAKCCDYPHHECIASKTRLIKRYRDQKIIKGTMLVVHNEILTNYGFHWAMDCFKNLRICAVEESRPIQYPMNQYNSLDQKAIATQLSKFRTLTILMTPIFIIILYDVITMEYFSISNESYLKCGIS